MSKNVLVSIFFVLSVLSAGGCCDCPIDESTYNLQKPAVQTATESARDAKAYWATYDEKEKTKWLDANLSAWTALNEVYNPPEVPEKTEETE